MSSPRVDLGPLTPEGRTWWRRANRQVLWGWKRDTGPHSRTVYYSARLASTRSGRIVCGDQFLFYRHRTHPAAARAVLQDLEAASPALRRLVGPVDLETSRDRRTGLQLIRLKVGHPSEADRDRTRRLVLRRPRRHIRAPVLPPPERDLHLPDLLPFDLYLGSGVSYEAGLPTLCDMHDAFCVDGPGGEGFAHGASDLLPEWLRSRPEETLRSFCDLHLRALDAPSTPAQRVVAELHREGQVGHVLTDNVDEQLAKVGVPFLRTRGSGVFNERFPVSFRTRTLVVVGVAADRREIVRQARGQGVRVVVVNPCHKVSPNVRHLDYLQVRDLFFQETAREFFTRLEDQRSGT